VVPFGATVASGKITKRLVDNLKSRDGEYFVWDGALAGFGVAQVQTSEQLWAALAFGPALRWQLVGPVSLWLQGEALVAITRPAFHMRNLDLLYRPEPAGAQGWLGIELRLD